MSCFQPNAWYHQMNEVEEVRPTVLLAANIIPISVRYMKNKVFLVSERSS